jgi:hypothetical protein
MWRPLWEDAYHYVDRAVTCEHCLLKTIDERLLIDLEPTNVDGGVEEHICALCCADRLNRRWYVRCSKRHSWPLRHRISKPSAFTGGGWVEVLQIFRDVQR